MADLKITQIIHPEYSNKSVCWEKWRLTYGGGDPFVSKYLRRFSRREDDRDFADRQLISYCPAFAKAAINEIKNSIFQRTADITRKGGPKSYLDAVQGRSGGVDLAGASMNSFLGRSILPELLPMARVGIFVDMPINVGPTIADKGNQRPYFYTYTTEQIRCWSYNQQKPDELIAVLLEDQVYNTDPITLLTTGYSIRYRHIWINEFGKVNVQYYDQESNPIYDVIELSLTKIPFVILELSGSLLEDVCNYQIALLNLESSDLLYSLKSNFPFYTEQFDPRAESLYLKPPGEQVSIVNSEAKESTQEVKVGAAAGRRYPAGLERPAFIAPSSEPLKASMEKGTRIKEDIRLLVNLAVQNLQSGRASAESKNLDNQTLEAGLSCIGLELEHAERQIAEIWTQYEGLKEIPSVFYPSTYTIKTEEQRRIEAKDCEDAMPKIPSKTYQKEMAKQSVEIRLGNKVSITTLEKIKSEIDSSAAVTTDPEIIKTDLENGLVGTELASQLRGYPEGEVEKAKKDHADRLARIAISQSQGSAAELNQARGVPDMGADQKAGSQEKSASRDTTTMETPHDATRGQGQ